VSLETSDAEPRSRRCGRRDLARRQLAAFTRTHYAANLMQVTPKSSWRWVKALLHSVYDQPDAEAVQAQFDRIVDALADKLPHVAAHLEEARAEILAFTAYPRDLWRLVAANILGETHDARHFRSAAAFAAHAGAAPVPASSGNTHRHRLARGGNRQLNRALFTIAMVQARWHPEARAYLARKRAEGKTGAEARRCLKRHLAAVVYRAMLRDLSEPRDLVPIPAEPAAA